MIHILTNKEKEAIRSNLYARSQLKQLQRFSARPSPKRLSLKERAVIRLKSIQERQQISYLKASINTQLRYYKDLPYLSTRQWNKVSELKMFLSLAERQV